MVSGGDRIGDLIKILEVEDPESALIFCNLRAETEQVAGALRQAGFNADWLNGDLPQRDRENIMQATREGKLRYLVATDVAARGIDISHLTHVINYSFPESAAQYVHRTGRTGRAGRTGSAISLVSPIELGRLYYLRLEFKISPIERSLPSKGELLTRKEGDRVAMLSEAFATAPMSEDLALARRLLTHPEAERIVGGLLRTFFGGNPAEVDEEAAAARRARPPARIESDEPAVTRRPPRTDGRRAERPLAQTTRAPRQEARESREPREARGPRREPPAGRHGPPATEPREADRPESDAAGPTLDDKTPAALLLLDVGRQDGVRVGEIARLVREVGGLERSEVGRIRVREHHTFVEVPDDKLDQTLDKLRGHSAYEKALSPERAKVTRG
jgi:ATP-dependent RNA helicase DeaD